MAIDSTKPTVAISQSGTDSTVVVGSSALPTGAATAAAQTTGNNSLASIDGKLPAALGAGGGVKVDGSGTALPVSAASLPLPTGAATAAAQTPPTATSGGYSNTSINAAATNNATSVKASAGQVYGVHVYNNAAYPIYVKLYNKATAPAPVTDTALLTRRIGVQAGTQRDITFRSGLPFSTGIGLAIVKGIADADNTSVAANDCLVELEWA